MGINYGRIANNLPSTVKVVRLLKSQGLECVKVYDTDPSVLGALSGSKYQILISTKHQKISSRRTRERSTSPSLQSSSYFTSPFLTLTDGGSMVINYSRIANNLPSATKVACKSLGPFHNDGYVLGIDQKNVKVPPLCDSRVKL
ncbi:hypothetical protein RYX36_002534, partial [Vicia faba]